MSTRIECTKCNDVVDLEASSITLPFICESCETIEFQEAIKPAVPAPANVGQQDHGLDESSATIENTTLLIEDLEKQVSLLQDSLDSSNKLIADMSAQLNEDAATLGERDREIKDLQGARDSGWTLFDEAQKRYLTANHLNERLQQDMSELISRLDKLRRQNAELGLKNFAQSQGVAKFAGQMFTLAGEWDAKEAELTEDVTNAEQQVALLERKLEFEKENTVRAELQRDFYKRKASYFQERFRDLVELENCGFWARVFNKKR